MKIVTNEKIIRRNKKIGQVTTIVSLVILGGGLFLSFQNDPTMLTYSLLALIIGFMTSQLGIYYSTRWSKSPRIDESITSELKGLDDKYTLYHFSSPVQHLLVGPCGILALLPFIQRGVITYEKNKWKQSGVNLYMRIFAQEGLGRVDLEIANTEDRIKKFLDKNLFDQADYPSQVALVFTNPKATVQAPDAPNATLQVDKLKDYVRRIAREAPFPMDKISTIQDALPKESVN